MEETTCFFTGHRRLPETMMAPLAGGLGDALEVRIDEGYREFISGGALGFDLLAARQVIAARERHPEISLVMALPAEGYERRWNLSQREVLQQVLMEADRVLWLAPFYTEGCMLARNRYMADHSSYCIAYLVRGTGGTAYTVRYAMERGIQVLNLAERVTHAFSGS